MTDNKGFIKGFFGGASKILTKIRVVIVNLFTLLMLIAILFSIGSILSQTETIEMPESGALRIGINGSLVDQKTYVDPLEMILNEDLPEEVLVDELIAAIDMAANDQRINSMTLVLDGLQGTGMSKIEEVGSAIMRFREAGKPVIAVADYYDQQKYLLASYANRILMHHMGAVELVGLASYQTYMQQALEKLKVNVHVFRTGPHKSAAEPFIASEMSEASREQTEWLLEDIWAEYKRSLMSRRDISEEQITAYSENIDQIMLETGMSLAEIALESNLIDALVTRDELMAEIQAMAGANEEGDFYLHTNAIPYYRNNVDQLDQGEPRVGYIVAKGTISDGIQPSGTIGGDSLAYQLKQARLNDGLEALVIRVDSPGGSAFASEIIRRELELFSENDVPVVVSMGALAASGGYWIAMPADEVWATETTITGSIGAFSIVPTIEESLDSLGLQTDGVETGPLAAAFRLDRPLSEKTKTIFQSQIDYLYAEFLNIVTNARDMSLDQLEPIAGGRVWTGTQALDIGLVDQIGDRLDAINSAARLAGIEDNYRVHKIEPQLTFSEELVRNFLESVSLKIDLGSFEWISKLHSLVNLKESTGIDILLSDPQHMYLHCDTCLIGI